MHDLALVDVEAIGIVPADGEPRSPIGQIAQSVAAIEDDLSSSLFPLGAMRCGHLRAALAHMGVWGSVCAPSAWGVCIVFIGVCIGVCTYSAGASARGSAGSWAASVSRLVPLDGGP